MITRDQIPQVVGHPVYDSQGKKIGDAKHMYLDDRTGEPEWVTVKTGFFGNSETFVPTRAAEINQDRLEVPYDKDQVKGAPNVDVGSGGHLSVDEERHLYQYYGLETRGTSADSGADDRAGAAAGSAGAAGQESGAPKQSGQQSGSAAGRDMGMERDPEAAGGGMTGSEAGVGTGGADYAAGRTGPAERLSGVETGIEDDAMTRSEEEIHVEVQRRASGKARLHKFVEIEDVEETIPIRHEEVRLEREPITEQNRAAALSGTEISESEHEVTLHEDQPVVDTRVVPKERVRMRVEERVEQKTVHGRVRKERIESDLSPEADASGPAAEQGRDDPRFR
jgi:stress response protein YsnF/sporulation protein YlmC with PRC-barrel domain